MVCRALIRLFTLFLGHNISLQSSLLSYSTPLQSSYVKIWLIHLVGIFVAVFISPCTNLAAFSPSPPPKKKKRRLLCRLPFSTTGKAPFTDSYVAKALCGGRTRVNFVYQIDFAKWFDRVYGWANFLCQIPWIYASTIAFGQRGRKHPRRETKSTSDKILTKVNGSFLKSMWLGSRTFIVTCGWKCRAEKNIEFAWLMENGGS